MAFRRKETTSAPPPLDGPRPGTREKKKQSSPRRGEDGGGSPDADADAARAPPPPPPPNAVIAPRRRRKEAGDDEFQALDGIRGEKPKGADASSSSDEEVLDAIFDGAASPGPKKPAMNFLSESEMEKWKAFEDENFSEASGGGGGGVPSEYGEDTELGSAPWWETGYLEERRQNVWGYSPAAPIWPTISHYAVMAHSLRVLLKMFELYRDGERIGSSCVRLMTVADLRRRAEAASVIGTKEVKKLKLKRTTKPKPVAISPEYRPVEHRTLKEAGHPFVCDCREVDFYGDDVLDVIRRRMTFFSRIKRRGQAIRDVMHWRVGKPTAMLREELIEEFGKKLAAAKKNNEKPPPSPFRRGGEAELKKKLTPVANDPRSTLALNASSKRLHRSGSLAQTTTLLHPEELEESFLNLLEHELTRFELYLSTTRYQVELDIDYDKKGRIIGDDAEEEKNRLCQACVVS